MEVSSNQASRVVNNSPDYLEGFPLCVIKTSSMFLRALSPLNLCRVLSVFLHIVKTDVRKWHPPCSCNLTK